MTPFPIFKKLIKSTPNFNVGSYFNVFFKFNLFLAALGLRCRMQTFSSCGEQGLLFVVVRELLIAVASLVVEYGLWALGLQ